MKIKKLVSCALTFGLAFSLFGIPGISFAQDGSSSASESSNSATETKAPTSEPDIDVDQLRGQQITGMANLLAKYGDEKQTPDEGEETDPQLEAQKAEFLEAMTAKDAKAIATGVTGGELTGSLVTVKLHTYKKSMNGMKATIAAGGFEQSAKFVAIPGETDVYAANITETKPVPAGNYDLVIEGAGYTPYSQPISLENGNKVTVNLGDNQENVYFKSYGIVPFGDFNEDGVVTNEDVKVLIAAIISGDNSVIYDFDGNDVVDISDVQIFASTLKNGAAGRPAKEKLIFETDAQEIVRKNTSNTNITPTEKVTMTVSRETTNEKGEILLQEFDPNNTSEDQLNELIRKTLLENTGATVCLGTEETGSINESKTKPSISISTTSDANTEKETVMQMEGMVINYPTNSQVENSSTPQAGVVVIEDENGNKSEYRFGDDSMEKSDAITEAISNLAKIGTEKADAAPGNGVEIDPTNGLIKVNFGSRIAVKKITIIVTETTKPDAKLVEIGTVEFLNNMEDFIAPPELNIPKNIKAVGGTKRIDVEWTQEANVSGYEINFKKGTQSVSHTTFDPKFTLQSWPYSTLKDVRAGTYTIKIRSINGEWTSPWSDPIDCEVVIFEKPKRPTAITVRPGTKELLISWPGVEDAKWYNLYYKENKAGAEFIKYPVDLTQTSLTLMGLKSNTEYILYLTASNNIGTSAPSDRRTGTTYGDIPVKVPWYNLINRKVQFANDPSITEYDNIIKKASIDYGHNNIGDSSQNDPATMCDTNYQSGYIFHNQNGAATFEFDKEYEINGVALTSSMISSNMYTSGALSNAMVRTVAADGTKKEYHISDGTLRVRDVGAGAPGTFYFDFPTSNAVKVTVEQNRYYSFKVAIAEIAFYKSDKIADEIKALWADDLHTTLTDGVTEDTIIDLETRSNTIDRISNEYNPQRANFLKELEDARNILNNVSLHRQARYFDSSIENGVNRNVNGINGWQPLGIAAYEGEQLNLFVGGMNGSTRQATNQNTALRLTICQFNSEPEAVSKEVVASLRTGQNIITIPTGLTSLAAEHGGQLYVEYLASDKNWRYGIRTLGGIEIPTLDVHNMKGVPSTIQAERLKKCSEYIQKLDQYMEEKESRHAEHAEVYPEYSLSTCIANTTDIVMDDMMYSVPLSVTYNAIGTSGTLEERAMRLNKGLSSMELMMQLFYQHKGLTHDQGKITTYGTSNGIPKGHLNMRCMRMKDGVLMYAAGNHIGVPFGGCGLVGEQGITFDSETGKWKSGSLYGWGYAHEIGHNINQGCYTIPEVTNNYYSQLVTNVAGSATSRYTNASIYKKVTSGTYSPLAGKTGIGLYWQLRNAYDNYYNFKLFTSYKEQMENLVMARIDAYARNPQAAPTSDGDDKVSLKLDGGTSDNLCRLASAATQKDLTSFFDAWGQKLNAQTKKYCAQFPKEEREIKYASDEAMAYRIEGGKSIADSIKLDVQMSVAGEQITSPTKVSSRQIDFRISQTGGSTDGLIGYEILRNGKGVAFVELASAGDALQDGVLHYTDTIATANNRAYTYTVRAIDKMLKGSESVALPQIKVSDDGTYADKTRWTVETNMISNKDVTLSNSAHNLLDSRNPMTCENEVEHSAAEVIIDNDASTTFEGHLPENGSVVNSTGAAVNNMNPYVEIKFNGEKQITAIKVPEKDAQTICSSKISVSTDGVEWVNVPLNTQILNSKDKTITFYFNEELEDGTDDPQLKIYSASHIRITGNMDEKRQGGFSLSELDVLGITGDNLEYLDGATVGTTATSVKYADESEVEEGDYTIPADTTVFVGSYKGDTAYNAMKMYDQNGNLIPGKQVFFADKPGEGRNLGTTADGRWIWYMTDEDKAAYKKAYKTDELFTKCYFTLYRVDDAISMKNERPAADTMWLEVDWDNLPSMEFQISNDFNNFKVDGE